MFPLRMEKLDQFTAGTVIAGRIASTSEPEKLHSSLRAALQDQKIRIPEVRKTRGLVSSAAEMLYRACRPVSSMARFIEDPQDNIDADVKATNPKKMCCFHNCRLTDQDSHMSLFMHPCLQGKACRQRSDPQHLKYYTHEDPNTNLSNKENASVISHRQDLQNPNQHLIQPSLKAAVYQNQQPRQSCIPRAGYYNTKFAFLK